MSRRGNNILYSIDWWTIIMFAIMVLFGWMNIYGASLDSEQASIFDFSQRAGKQFVWILTAVFLGTIILAIDYKTYDTLAYLLYAGMILLLLVTPLLAHNVKGSYSWITLGPVSLQPAEFAKCVTALAVAKYMGRYEYQLRNWKDLIVPFLLIGVPMMIIMLLQRETGSALVFCAFVLVFYRQGMSGYILWAALMTVILFVLSVRFGNEALPLGVGNIGILSCMLVITMILFYFMQKEERKLTNTLIAIGSIIGIYGIACILAIWFPINFNYVSVGINILLLIYLIVQAFIWRKWKQLLVVAFAVFTIVFSHGCNIVFQKILQPHQRIRIEVLLGMREDPNGAGYNVQQAKIAIGSGQFFGKGYLQGTQTKLHYVPEQDTDFIFCTVGEEWGFLGTTLVLILYAAFILRLIRIAERQKDAFSMIYSYIVACIFLFHLTINIGMVIGLLPVIGIPLPFFSYGGSSLWGFTILLFILLRLDASRNEKLQ